MGYHRHHPQRFLTPPHGTRRRSNAQQLDGLRSTTLARTLAGVAVVLAFAFLLDPGAYVPTPPRRETTGVANGVVEKETGGASQTGIKHDHSSADSCSCLGMEWSIRSTKWTPRSTRRNGNAKTEAYENPRSRIALLNGGISFRCLHTTYKPTKRGPRANHKVTPPTAHPPSFRTRRASGATRATSP